MTMNYRRSVRIAGSSSNSSFILANQPTVSVARISTATSAVIGVARNQLLITIYKLYSIVNTSFYK